MEKRMRKFILLFLMLVAVVLTGCIPQVQATPTLTATTNARPAPTVALTVPAQAAISPDSGCTVITQKPTPGPTPVSIYPPITDSDWVKGPASAKVTIIEYSDFQ
jgi:predicted component of type VI protein secretion system